MAVRNAILKQVHKFIWNRLMRIKDSVSNSGRSTGAPCLLESNSNVLVQSWSICGAGNWLTFYISCYFRGHKFLRRAEVGTTHRKSLIYKAILLRKNYISTSLELLLPENCREKPHVGPHFNMNRKCSTDLCWGPVSKDDLRNPSTLHEPKYTKH